MVDDVLNVPFPIVLISLASLVKSTSSATRLRRSGGDNDGICATVIHSSLPYPSRLSFRYRALYLPLFQEQRLFAIVGCSGKQKYECNL